MTVKELREALAKYPDDAIVVYPDTYAQNEGYWEGCDEETIEIDSIMTAGNNVILF